MKRLVDRILGGERDAYADIVSKYEKMLVSYVSFRVPYANMVDELVHETFIRAYELLEEYDVERDFGTWLRTLCYYQIMREFKRFNREKIKKDDYLQQVRCELWEETIDLHEKGEINEEIGELSLCIEKLPQKSKNLIALRYEENKSVNAIAEYLDRNVSWVTTTLSRIRMKLKKCIEEQYQDD